MELVSVLIPVYNVEKYIEQAIQSMINQTYHNIEIIVVDDCSTDHTYDIVKKMQEKDNRIKLYKNKKNLKIVDTLNFAYEKSTGQYICRMDGDDISDCQRIEKKVEFLKKNKNISLVGCSVKTINEKGEFLRTKKMQNNAKTLDRLLKFANPVFHIWLAKREVYEKLKGYRNIPCVEDYDFLLRMKSYGFEFTNISDYYGYSIRIREGNTLSTAGLVQKKAHRYCYDLYKQRIKTGVDDFSVENFYDVIKITEKEKKSFDFSRKYLEKAINTKNKSIIRKIKYVFYSFVLSKEQRIYIKDRLIASIIEKIGVISNV